MIVTDHHECKPELPAACAIVNPHQPDCPYPFTALAGVGVALKVVLALGGPGGNRTVCWTGMRIWPPWAPWPT